MSSGDTNCGLFVFSLFEDCEYADVVINNPERNKKSEILCIYLNDDLQLNM